MQIGHAGGGWGRVQHIYTPTAYKATNNELSYNINGLTNDKTLSTAYTGVRWQLKVVNNAMSDSPTHPVDP